MIYKCLNGLTPRAIDVQSSHSAKKCTSTLEIEINLAF